MAATQVYAWRGKCRRYLVRIYNYLYRTALNDLKYLPKYRIYYNERAEDIHLAAVTRATFCLSVKVNVRGWPPTKV